MAVGVKDMGKLKVLKLSDWSALFKGDKFDEGELYQRVWIKEAPYREEIPIVVGRNGYYFQNGKCWAEVYDTAYELDGSHFLYALKSYDSDMYLHYADELRAICRTPLATNTQKELLYFVEENLKGRREGRDRRRRLLRVLSRSPAMTTNKQGAI